MNKKQLVEYINNYIIQLNTLSIEHNFDVINLEICKVVELKNIYYDCIKLINNYKINNANQQSYNNFVVLKQQLENIKYAESDLNKINEFKTSFVNNYNKIIEYNNKLKTKTYIISPKLYTENFENKSNIHLCPICKKQYVYQSINKQAYLECCSVECETQFNLNLIEFRDETMQLVKKYSRNLLFKTLNNSVNYFEKFTIEKNKYFLKITNSLDEFYTYITNTLINNNIVNESDIKIFFNDFETVLNTYANHELDFSKNITLINFNSFFNTNISSNIKLINNILFGLISGSLFKGKGEFLLTLFKNIKHNKSAGDVFDISLNQIIEVKSGQKSAVGSLVDNRNRHINTKYISIEQYIKAEKENHIKFFKNFPEILTIINASNDFNLNHDNSVQWKIINYLITNNFNNCAIKDYLYECIFNIYFEDSAKYLYNSIDYRNIKTIKAIIAILMIYHYINNDLMQPTLNLIIINNSSIVSINNVKNIISDKCQLNQWINLLENIKIHFPYFRGGVHDRNKTWAGGIQLLNN